MIITNPILILNRTIKLIKILILIINNNNINKLILYNKKIIETNFKIAYKIHVSI